MPLKRINVSVAIIVVFRLSWCFGRSSHIYRNTLIASHRNITYTETQVIQEKITTYTIFFFLILFRLPGQMARGDISIHILLGLLLSPLRFDFGQKVFTNSRMYIYTNGRPYISNLFLLKVLVGMHRILWILWKIAGSLRAPLLVPPICSGPEKEREGERERARERKVASAPHRNSRFGPRGNTKNSYRE